MTYKTHIVSSLALGTPAVMFMNADDTLKIVYMVGIFIGSLFPDVDHRDSFAAKMFGPLSIPFWLLFEHRGFTHSLKGFLIISALFFVPFAIAHSNEYRWANIYLFGWMGFTVGYIGHILGDATTRSGIMNFCCKKRLKIPVFGEYRTGEIKEEFIFILFFVILIGEFAFFFNRI